MAISVTFAAPAVLGLDVPLPAPPLEVVPAPVAAVAADGIAIVAVGTGIPEVKGAFEIEVAPENAAEAVADGLGFGEMDEAFGLRTLFQHC